MAALALVALLACRGCGDTDPTSSCPLADSGGPLDADGDGRLDAAFAEGDRCDGVDRDRFREGVVVCEGTLARCSDDNTEELGSWTPAFPWPSAALRTEAAHMAVLPNGKVLSMYHGSDLEDGYFPNTFDPATLWDPKTEDAVSVAAPVPAEDGNLFCSAHNHLADGRMLFTGGDVTAAKPAEGIDSAWAFDGATWTYLGAMAGGKRWYPNNLTLADASVLVTSGAIVVEPYTVNDAVDLYLPAQNRFELRSPQSFTYLYPWMHLLPDGRVVSSGQEAQARVWDPTTDVWAPYGPPRISYREYGTATTLLLDGTDPTADADILVAGGCEGRDSARCCLDDLVLHEFEGDCDLPDGPDSATWECFSTAEVLGGFATGVPIWEPAGAMVSARAHSVATLLPDGNVVLTGGEGNDCRPPPFSELYDAATRTFSATADYVDQYNGDYHTSAVLLPDGRVVVSGGDLDALDDNGPTAMIYSPPYLDLDCCARPTVLEMPTELHYGQSFTVRVDDAEVDALVFLRPGATTHEFNMDQRGVRVPVVGMTAAGAAWSAAAVAPLTPGLAPPGYYMMFALNVDGVPSEAVFVQLTAGECDQTTCDEPPVSSCVDTQTSRQYSVVGDCFEGSCQYASESVACEVPADAPEGTVVACHQGECVAGCPAGGEVCGEQCCVAVEAGTTETLPGGDYTLGTVEVAGELVLTGAVELDAESFVVREGGLVRCAATGASEAGAGADGDGVYAGAGGGGGGAVGAGGAGGLAWEDGTVGGAGGAAWVRNANQCAGGGPGGQGGGGGYGGEGGPGGGGLTVRAAVITVAGSLRCDAADGAPGEYDDGGGGGGAGGCLSLVAGALSIEPTAGFSVVGAAGGAGGYCAPEDCGAAYCGGGGGGGGGGAVFMTCESCIVDGAVIGKSAVDSAIAARSRVESGEGGAEGTAADGGCDPSATTGVGGEVGVVRSY